MDSITERQCNVCKEIKDIYEFSKDRQKKDGFSRTCKKCNKERVYAWSKENHERDKKNKREFYRKNREDINKKRRIFRKLFDDIKKKARAYAKSYKISNYEKLKEYQEKWVSENKDKIKKSRKVWENKNKEKLRISANNYRSLKKKAGVFTEKEWEDVKRKYGYKCLSCGKKEPFVKLTIDHVVPLSKGGENKEYNIQPLCGSCNSSKKDRIIDFRS